MKAPTLGLLKRCAMAAILVASTAFAASGDASGPAPAFTLTALTGQQAALSQYKGQVVMVNFWATWCGPCQQEMPLLDQMYKKYKPAGFTLIGVNVDKDAPPVKELLARKPVSFPVLPTTRWHAITMHSGLRPTAAPTSRGSVPAPRFRARSP